MDNIENNHHSRDWSINPSSPSSSSDSAKRIANDEILLEDIEKEFIIIAPEKDETPEWTVLIHKNDYQDILLRIGLEIEKQEMQAMNTPTPGTRASFLDTATRSSIETTKAEAASGWGGGPPPNIESIQMRKDKTTHPIKSLAAGTGIQISHQVHLDFGRTIQVFINQQLVAPTGKENVSIEKAAKGYGLEDQEWNPQSNKLLDLFDQITNSIQDTATGSVLDRERIDELVHTALEGSCQTFDAVLSNPMNAALQEHGCVFINDPIKPPTVMIDVGENHIVVRRRQPMLIKDIESMSMYTAMIERSFEIDISTGTCQPKNADIVVNWMNQIPL